MPKKNITIGTVPIIRTDGIYFLIAGGTFEHEGVRGSFAPTVGGAAMVVYINEVDGKECPEAYEVSTRSIVETILAARKAKPATPPPQVTAKTITNVQINALLAIAISEGSKAVARTCKVALDEGATHRTKAQIDEARGRCAAIINDTVGLLPGAKHADQ